MFLFALLIAMIVFNTDLAFAKKGDSKSKNMIELCCTWGDSLDDGVLTFSIKNGGSDLAKIVKLAIKDWERLLDGAVKFFNEYGFINFVEISLSKKSYGITLDTPTLEHVAKHEFGHALGLGHANFKNTLMSPNVDEVISKVSACELESVKYANHWKFVNNDNSPHPLDKEGFKCKKK